MTVGVAIGCTLACLIGAWVSDDVSPVDEMSLMQTSHLVHGSAKQALLSSAGPARDAGSWPNPADPNLEPTLMQRAVFPLLKTFPHTTAIVNMTLSLLAITPVWYVVENGGYDILFRALHDYAHDSTVQMNAWRGLSDQSHTEVGSNYIANYGGQNKGIEYMVKQLLAHPRARDAECADHLTYQYEVIQCISGLLSWDVYGTRGVAAVATGLLPAVIHAMRVEGDLRPTVDVCCKTISSLLTHNTSYVEPLQKLGVVELIKTAIANYSAYDPTPFYFGSTYGDSYPVVPSCNDSLHIIQAHLSSTGARSVLQK